MCFIHICQNNSANQTNQNKFEFFKPTFYFYFLILEIDFSKDLQNLICYLAAPQRGQPHTANVNHCVIQFQPKGHQEPNNQVGSISLTDHLVGFKPQPSNSITTP